MSTITLTFEKVKQDVLRLSEYIGLKAGAYDRIRAIVDDSQQLHRWWDEGLALVCQALDRIIDKPTLVTDDTATLRLTNDNDHRALLEDTMVRCISTHIMVRWLKLVAPQLVEGYMGDHVQAMNELERLAYFREMPK